MKTDDFRILSKVLKSKIDSVLLKFIRQINQMSDL